MLSVAEATTGVVCTALVLLRADARLSPQMVGTTCSHQQVQSSLSSPPGPRSVKARGPSTTHSQARPTRTSRYPTASCGSGGFRDIYQHPTSSPDPSAPSETQLPGEPISTPYVPTTTSEGRLRCRHRVARLGPASSATTTAGPGSTSSHIPASFPPASSCSHGQWRPSGCPRTPPFIPVSTVDRHASVPDPRTCHSRGAIPAESLPTALLQPTVPSHAATTGVLLPPAVRAGRYAGPASGSTGLCSHRTAGTVRRLPTAEPARLTRWARQCPATGPRRPGGQRHGLLLRAFPTTADERIPRLPRSSGVPARDCSNGRRCNAESRGLLPVPSCSWHDVLPAVVMRRRLPALPFDLPHVYALC